mmetsp:Transcript_52237/g.126219  ORF Transcript_52237/g.126219 Transcript_52237/m.126219 type:complete len:298 (+) Transcript_52237:1115-2008(+)
MSHQAFQQQEDWTNQHRRHRRHHRHHRHSEQHRYYNRVDLAKQLVLPETETETETSDSSFQSSSSFAKEDVDRKSPPAKKNQNTLVPIVEAKTTTTSIRGILSSNKTSVSNKAAAKKNVQFETGEDLVKVFVEKDKEDNNNDDDDDDEHDSDSDSEESDATAETDLWYSREEYSTFRSRESKVVKEMSKSFDDGAFSVDGVESLQYKRERRRRMNKSRFDVLLLQESFWEEMERMERLEQTGQQKQQSPCDDDKYNQKRRDVLLARTYIKASTASVVLALQRADWNAKQVRDDNVKN